MTGSTAIRPVYEGGHLTRETRAMLARVYLDAEDANSLQSKIERQAAKRDKKKASATAAPSAARSPPPPPTTNQAAPVDDASAAPTAAAAAPTKPTLEALVAQDQTAERWGEHHKHKAKPKAPKSSEPDWTSIIAYEHRRFEREVGRIEAADERKKNEYRASLLGQIRDRQQMEQRHQAILQDEITAKHQELDEYHRYLEQCTTRRNAKTQALKESRIEQLQALEHDRTSRRAHDKLVAERACDTVRAKLLSERAEAIASKRAYRAELWQVIRDNNMQRQRKLDEQAKQFEEDRALQKVYVATMDKREADRARTVQDRVAKSKLMLDLSEHVFAAQRDSLHREDQRVQAAQRQIRQAQEERQHRELTARKTASDEVKAVLQQQIRERQHRKRVVQDEDRAYQAQLVQIARDDSDKRHRDAVRIGVVKRKLQEDLKKQFELVAAKKESAKVAMSETERKMNSRILQSIAAESAPTG